MNDTLRQSRATRVVRVAIILAVIAGIIGPQPAGRPARAYPISGTYQGEPIENCADPAITSAAGEDGLTHWYLYCTSDPLNDGDRNPDGSYNFHRLAILHSTDLINWTYAGDVFAALPAWVRTTISPDAGLWAPEVQFLNGQWYLYYTAAIGTFGGGTIGASAIGVATSPSPTGPWVDSESPVVESQPTRWVYDPAVVRDDSNGALYLFYGGYAGGISARTLSNDGLSTDPSSEVQITIPDRYEGAHVQKRDGYYYLFVSATNCCNDELTGYSVFAGRSEGVLGPYVDKDGISLLESRVGGTPVISMNGNRWVGPGHNSMLTDFAGQDWFVYHAVNRFDPKFANPPGFTKRAPMLDPLDWVDGWPTVRGGLWASDFDVNADPAAPLPAAQPGTTGRYTVSIAEMDQPGQLLANLSDEFDLATGQWSWVRQPAQETYSLPGDGAFRMETQPADLHQDQNSASVLVETAPQHDYVVETRLHLPLPADGSNHNFVQAGLVIYGDDDNYLKLVHVAIGETRQTEFAKEIPTGRRYGNTVVGPPADWVYLRIARRSTEAEELYTVYTSRDGLNWVRGGTWTHNLGAAARIGLVAMGGSGFTASFDYVRVYTLAPAGTIPPAPAHEDFWETWARTDKPVQEMGTSADHSWIWGPSPFTLGMEEQYVESPDGQRQVQYFDKSRMELNDPNAPDDDLWHVTNGLLVWEMVNGWYQIGDDFLDTSPDPADVNLAGDPGERPTYADIGRFGLLDAPPLAAGTAITSYFSDTGQIEQRDELATYGVTAAWQVAETGHTVASPFWSFMTAQGTVFIENQDAEDDLMGDGAYVIEPLFENAFYATGFPITEAYWSRVIVGGQEKDVLWQCFERRCLTYTPSNPTAYRVEAANVGQHYYRWRYAE